MSSRRPLLSALTALSLGATPALALETPVPADAGNGEAGHRQEALAGLDAASVDLAGQIARLAAVAGPLDAELSARLRGCLRDLQEARAEPASIEEMVWRNARSMECLAALQFSRLQLAQAEIY